MIDLLDIAWQILAIGYVEMQARLSIGQVKTAMRAHIQLQGYGVQLFLADERGGPFMGQTVRFWLWIQPVDATGRNRPVAAGRERNHILIAQAGKAQPLSSLYPHAKIKEKAEGLQKPK